MTFRFSQLPAKRSLIVGVCAVAILAQPGLIRNLQAQQADAPLPAKAPNSIFAPTPIIPNAKVVEEVIARVNDQIISSADLERARQQLEQEAHQQSMSQMDLQVREDNLLRDLIDQQLLLSKGKQLGITGDVELIRRLDEIRKQNHFDSMEALQKAAEQQGVSFEDFKANIRNSIITQEVVRDEVSSHLQVSEADIQKYYQDHKSSFDRPESVRLSEILIPTPAEKDGEPAEATVTAALAKASEVEAKLKAGADFAEMAKLYSGGPTAQQGGDLGTFQRGALAKVLEDKTFALQAGQWTEPIRTKQGYIILKTTEHTAGGIPSLKEVEPEVEQDLYMEEMQPALRAYLTKLREQAYIDIKPGYVDSGASPLETKPVFSAYAPPAPKKKKVVEKKRFERHVAHKASSAPGVEKVGTTANGKPKKIKREKIRFGQAPRESLPAETQAEAADSTANGQAQPPADGSTAAAQTEAALLANPNADPLAPKEVKEKKSRYMDRMKLPKSKQKKKKEFGEDTPPPPTVQEARTQKVQSAPLGLGGDTAAKKKKKKHVKGEKKERYSDKAQDKPEAQPAVGTGPAAATPVPTPTPAPAPQQ